MKPKLSIIILSWNTKEILKNCLESIWANSKGINLEIIVIDNASTDGSVEYIKSLKHKNLKPVFNSRNLGFAKGNNQGIKKTTGKYILLLNSDTVVKPKALLRLIKYFDDHPQTAAICPMLLNLDGTNQIDYFMKFPNIAQILLYHNILLRPLTIISPLGKLVFSHGDYKKPFKVDQIPGAALLTKKEILNKIGGLDENFHFLFEDVDWCYRICQEKIGDLIIVPHSKVIHIGGASWKQWLNNDRVGFYSHYFQSFLKFIKKHKPKKLSLFKNTMKLVFLINALIHLLTFNLKKAKVQFQLIRKINKVN